MPFITKVKAPHKCRTPRPFRYFSTRPRFGDGTIWSCRKCEMGYRITNGEWNITLVV